MDLQWERHWLGLCAHVSRLALRRTGMATYLLAGSVRLWRYRSSVSFMLTKRRGKNVHLTTTIQLQEVGLAPTDGAGRPNGGRWREVWRGVSGKAYRLQQYLRSRSGFGRSDETGSGNV